MKVFIFFYAILCFSCFINGAKLPTNFQRCKVSEATDFKTNKCLEVAVQNAIRYLSINGDEGLNLPDLDPLRVSEIAIREGNQQGPISLEVIFKNVNLHGVSSYKVKSFRGKVSSPKDFVFTLDGVIDRLRLIGDYTMNGRVLILPVRGAGACNLTLDGVRVGCTITGESYTKNGKEFLKVKGYKMSLVLTRAYLYFENLFNDKAIGDNMNKFMNENWHDIYSELRPSIEHAIGKLFEIYTRRVFDKIQFKNIFIVE